MQIRLVLASILIVVVGVVISDEAPDPPPCLVLYVTEHNTPPTNVGDLERILSNSEVKQTLGIGKDSQKGTSQKTYSYNLFVSNEANQVPGSNRATFTIERGSHLILHEVADREIQCLSGRSILDLDAQGNCVYKLKVGIQEGRNHAYCNVHVLITDLNDNPAAFEEPNRLFDIAIPEHTALNTRYQLPMATDVDLGENSRIQYALSDIELSKSPLPNMEVLRRISGLEELRPFVVPAQARTQVQPAFRLEEAAGNLNPGQQQLYLVVAQDLDYERNNLFFLNLSACDPSNLNRLTLLKQPCTYKPIRIRVIDINDHRPVFKNGTVNVTQYSVRVRENQAATAEILRVVAEDADGGEHGTVTYSLKDVPQQGLQGIQKGVCYQGVAEGYFAIDATSGSIRILKPLDRESCARYLLIVSATDANVGGSLSLPNQGNPNANWQSSSSGVHTATAQINITVEDANDNPPDINTFHQFDAVNDFAIQENQPIGTIVGSFQTGDRDSATEYKRVTCRLGDNSFALEEQTGDMWHLKSNRSFDAETRDLFTIELTCENPLTAPLPGEISPPSEKQVHQRFLRIKVIDENDQAPHFTQARVIFKVVENNDPDTTVGALEVEDLDIDSKNRRFQLEVLGEEARFFYTKPNSSEVFTRIQFDRESKDEYQFQVRVYDPELEEQAQAQGGTLKENRYSVISVLVEIEDANDHPPIIVYQNVSLSENTPYSKFVAKVTASDPDAKHHAQATFSFWNSKESRPVQEIISTPEDSPRGTMSGSERKRSATFSISGDGEIYFIRGVLDREVQAIHCLTLMAMDSPLDQAQSASILNSKSSRQNKAPVSLTTFATFCITVEDMNDNGPEFKYPSDTNNTLNIRLGSWQAGQRKRVELTRILAEDGDAPDAQGPWPNREVNYTLKSNCADCCCAEFVLDELTGVLSLGPKNGDTPTEGASPLPKQPIMLRIEVADNGQPRRTNEAVLLVNILPEANPDAQGIFWMTSTRNGQSEGPEIVLVIVCGVLAIFLLLLLFGIAIILYCCCCSTKCKKGRDLDKDVASRKLITPSSCVTGQKEFSSDTTDGLPHHSLSGNVSPLHYQLSLPMGASTPTQEQQTQGLRLLVDGSAGEYPLDMPEEWIPAGMPEIFPLAQAGIGRQPSQISASASQHTQLSYQQVLGPIALTEFSQTHPGQYPPGITCMHHSRLLSHTPGKPPSLASSTGTSCIGTLSGNSGTANANQFGNPAANSPSTPGEHSPADPNANLFGYPGFTGSLMHNHSRETGYMSTFAASPSGSGLVHANHSSNRLLHSISAHNCEGRSTSPKEEQGLDFRQTLLNSAQMNFRAQPQNQAVDSMLTTPDMSDTNEVISNGRSEVHGSHPRGTGCIGVTLPLPREMLTSSTSGAFSSGASTHNFQALGELRPLGAIAKEVTPALQLPPPDKREDARETKGGRRNGSEEHDSKKLSSGLGSTRALGERKPSTGTAEVNTSTDSGNASAENHEKHKTSSSSGSGPSALLAAPSNNSLGSERSSSVSGTLSSTASPLTVNTVIHRVPATPGTKVSVPEIREVAARPRSRPAEDAESDTSESSPRTPKRSLSSTKTTRRPMHRDRERYKERPQQLQHTHSLSPQAHTEATTFEPELHSGICVSCMHSYPHGHPPNMFNSSTLPYKHCASCGISIERRANRIPEDPNQLYVTRALLSQYTKSPTTPGRRTPQPPSAQAQVLHNNQNFDSVGKAPIGAASYTHMQQALQYQYARQLQALHNGNHTGDLNTPHSGNSIQSLPLSGILPYQNQTGTNLSQNVLPQGPMSITPILRSQISLPGTSLLASSTQRPVIKAPQWPGPAQHTGPDQAIGPFAPVPQSARIAKGPQDSFAIGMNPVMSGSVNEYSNGTGTLHRPYSVLGSAPHQNSRAPVNGGMPLLKQRVAGELVAQENQVAEIAPAVVRETDLDAIAPISFGVASTPATATKAGTGKVTPYIISSFV